MRQDVELAPQTEFAERLEAPDTWEAMLPVRGGRSSHRAWLEDHRFQVYGYLNAHYDPKDVRDKYNELYETNPAKLRALVTDYMRPNGDKFRWWVKYLGKEDGKLGVMMGGKGKWKTSTAGPVTYYVKKIYKRRICALTLGGSLPHVNGEQFLERIVMVEEAPKGALVLIDEANRTFNSRNSMGKAQRGLGGHLSTLRHQENSAIAITQNSTMADVNLSRMLDFIWLKPLGYSQHETERGYMRNFLTNVKEITPLEPQQNAILSDKGPPMTFWMNRAPWWLKKFSFSFSALSNDEDGEEQAIPIAVALRRGGRDWEDIKEEIGTLKLHRDVEWWIDAIVDACNGLDPQTNKPFVKAERADDGPRSFKPRDLQWRPKARP